MQKLLSFTVITLIILVNISNAVSIGVNFGSNESSLASTDVAGVVAQANWNGADGSGGSLNDLIDDGGYGTTTDVSWSATGTWHKVNANVTGDEKLMYGYLDPIWGDQYATVTLSQVPYATYDLYVYMGTNNDGVTGHVTDGTTTYSYTNSFVEGVFPGFTQTTDTGEGAPTANYAVFSGLTGDVTVTAGEYGGAGGIMGIQIVEAGPSGPGRASAPNPGDGTVGVSTTVDLSWTAGDGATSHDVYFGTTSPGDPQPNQTGTTFDPGVLTNNTTYYWRIDEVNVDGTTTGLVWSFTTAALEATNPSPSNGTVGLSTDTNLSWVAGEHALSHDIYFGTSETEVTNAQRLAGDINGNGTVDIDDLQELALLWLADANLEDFAALAANWGLTAAAEFKGNQTDTTFDPGTLNEGVTYYWRIDEINAYGTTTGTVWSFTTVPELVITNINPSNYTIHYDSLTDGQTVYIDRSYTYSSVPAAYQGKTYIRTANDDKDSTAAPFLTFTVNQDVTVYVAHDDRTAEPAWLALFEDTNENLVIAGQAHSLLKRNFDAGTVSLGGNEDTNDSGSMYTVIVVGKGTVTPPDPVLSSDVYSDTWVAVDALGRALPDYDDCGSPRSDRYVALFYFLALGEHGPCGDAFNHQGPYDITKLLAANPSNPAYGPAPCYFPVSGTGHHWGEPEMGYYLSDDQWVIRKHAYMLANAGVDVIVFDVTNYPRYTSNYMTVCSVFSAVRAEGGTTPQIAFMTNWNADDQVQNLYNEFYAHNYYPDLWFYWKGKPLILGPLNGMNDPAGGTINYSSTVQNFFNFRYAWADTAGSGQDIWSWIDMYPQPYGWHDNPSTPEAVSVSCGRHANYSENGQPHPAGRSYHNGSEPSLNQYWLTGYEDQGFFFDEQWSRLDQIDPEFVFITGWNEWVAGRFIIPLSGDLSGNYPFLDHWVGSGETLFVDCYNQEFSRDIEPMKDGHTDNYYYQMIDGIRRYKGVRQLPAPSAAKTIAIDGNFSDWLDVAPEYRDWVGDTVHRSSEGWGAGVTYVDNTGRNDFIVAKVARDDTYVYFYIWTDANITSYTDSNWMELFINSDQNYSTGWNGYDYVVNMDVVNSTITTLKYTSSEWNWTDVNTNIAYRVLDNQMEIRIPRSDIGQGSGGDCVAFDFHWADNIQQINSMIEFALHGDSAPDRRFNYCYDTH